MRAFLVFSLFCCYALGARWYYVCQIRGLCAGEEDVRLRTLTLREGDEVLLRGYDQFAFDSAAVLPRLNDNNRLFLDSVAAILQRDTIRQLSITAEYRESEAGVKPGFFENLGVARAAEVRKELMKRGVAEERVTLDYRVAISELLREPAAFELYRPDTTSSTYERVQFTFTNMTFSQANFAFDSDVFRPGEPFILYADSLKTYLSLNPENRLIIIGHTDNIDTDAYNHNLGMRRAKSARQYLIELGITSPIEVQSMGETRPVATNQTDEGRAKNRRVNFVVTDAGS